MTETKEEEMKEQVGALILGILIRLGFIKIAEGGRIIWLNESWSTNDPWRLDKEPWRSDRRGGFIQLPPGY